MLKYFKKFKKKKQKKKNKQMVYFFCMPFYSIRDAFYFNLNLTRLFVGIENLTWYELPITKFTLL